MIEELEVQNLRCHQKKKIKLYKGLNLIIGSNGVGKTTILEACELLYQNNVFTGAKSEDLIKSGEKKSIIFSLMKVNDSEISAKLKIDSEGIVKSYTPTSFRDSLAKYQTVVTLCREDFDLVSKEFSSKRNYLDEGALIYFGKSYKKLKSDFNKALKNRNALLKAYPTNLKTLETFTALFDDITQQIREKRKFFIRELEILLPSLIPEIFDREMPIKIVYEESSKDLEGEKFENAIHSKTSLYGAQRDKFIIFLDGRDFRSQLSIGERKALVYLLKTALMLCSIENKLEPIFFIDDFSSEIDAERRSRIIKLFLKYASQVLITTTQSVDLEKIKGLPAYNLIEL